VEDARAERESLIALLSGDDVETTAVSTGQQAVETLKEKPFDCLVLDLRLPDTGGLDLARRIRSELGLGQLPIIVHTGKELSDEEEEALVQATSTIVLKDAKSPERLVEEVSLFLHRQAAGLGAQRRILEVGARRDPDLAGRTVLVVDDDMRNIYALTTVLEESRMNVVYAQDGRKAIDELARNPAIDLVLMDIMMPEMDGYQAMREIRQIDRFQKLPMIALTAKAMKGDRERCIEAGASDYIPKPVDMERLLSLLRVWLYAEK
jgi:CheY-like chemotaxis protein